MGREELNKLGPLSRDEKITAGALGLTVGLWVFGGQLGIGAVAAALLGLAVLLITNVVTWKECLSDNQARPSPSTLTLMLTGLAVLLITSVVTWRECLSDNQARLRYLAQILTLGLAVLLMPTWSPGRSACPTTRHALFIADLTAMVLWCMFRKPVVP